MAGDSRLRDRHVCPVDERSLAVAGYVMLRLWCPAVTTPHSMSLMDQPSAAAGRTLVLVGSILQMLSNGRSFADSHVLHFLNPMLTELQPRLEAQRRPTLSAGAWPRICRAGRYWSTPPARKTP